MLKSDSERCSTVAIAGPFAAPFAGLDLGDVAVNAIDVVLTAVSAILFIGTNSQVVAADSGTTVDLDRADTGASWMGTGSAYTGPYGGHERSL